MHRFVNYPSISFAPTPPSSGGASSGHRECDVSTTSAATDADHGSPEDRSPDVMETIPCHLSHSQPVTPVRWDVTQNEAFQFSYYDPSSPQHASSDISVDCDTFSGNILEKVSAMSPGSCLSSYEFNCIYSGDDDGTASDVDSGGEVSPSVKLGILLRDTLAIKSPNQTGPKVINDRSRISTGRRKIQRSEAKRSIGFADSTLYECSGGSSEPSRYSPSFLHDENANDCSDVSFDTSAYSLSLSPGYPTVQLTFDSPSPSEDSDSQDSGILITKHERQQPKQQQHDNYNAFSPIGGTDISTPLSAKASEMAGHGFFPTPCSRAPKSQRLALTDCTNTISSSSSSSSGGAIGKITKSRRSNSTSALSFKNKVTFRQASDPTGSSLIEDNWNRTATHQLADSPVKLRRHKLTSCESGTDSADDSCGEEFLSLEQLEYESKTKKAPDTLDILGDKCASYTCTVAPKIERKNSRKNRSVQIKGMTRKASFKLQVDEEQPCMLSPKARCNLFRSKSVQYDSSPADFQLFRGKRPKSPTDTPATTKRRKSFLGEQSPVLQHVPATPASAARRPALLQRCQSESAIKSVVNLSNEQQDYVGDFSCKYSLPTIPSRHQDLKAITSNTMCQLLAGDFDDQIENYVIVDCRYPYEYDGGHIKESKNWYLFDQIQHEFFSKNGTYRQKEGQTKRSIVIFHCEFSSERAPKMARFVRNLDREIHKDTYPELYYPEIYLLHQGYKQFYSHHANGYRGAEVCEPCGYKPMKDKSHAADLKHFRQKSKSWAGDTHATMRASKYVPRYFMKFP